MEFKEVIESRYSCKKYSDKKVEREKLEAVLEAGRLAPTAKNLQEQHVYVLESKETLDKFDIETPCRYGAPTVLVVALMRPMSMCIQVKRGIRELKMQQSLQLI